MHNQKREPKKPLTAARVIRNICIFLLVCVLIIVGLIPTIASTRGAREWILVKINSRLDGAALKVDSWSLGWLAGQTAEGVSYVEPGGTTMLIANITTSRGLAAMIGPQINTGEVTLRQLRGRFVMPEEKGGGLTADEAAGAETAGPADDSDGVSGAPAPSRVKPDPGVVRPAVDIAGTLVVEDGSIEIVSGSNAFKFDSVNARVQTRGLKEAVKFKFVLKQAEKGGMLDLSGSANLFQAGEVDLKKMHADVSLDARDYDVRSIGDLARTINPKMPSVRGKLDGRGMAEIRGIDKIKADVALKLHDIALSGGMLGADRPKIKEMGLVVDCLREGKALTIRKLAFDSPFAALRGQGTLSDEGGDYAVGSVTVRGQVDLAVLAGLIPDTMSIEKGVKITEGLFQGVGTLNSTTKKKVLALELSLPRLEAMRGTVKTDLEKPININGQLSIVPSGWNIDGMKIVSSFASGSVAGNLRDMKGTIEADLDDTMREVGKFLTLGKAVAQGHASAEVRIQSAYENLQKLTGTLKIRDLKLSGLTPGPIRLASASGKISTGFQLNDAGQIGEMRDLSAQLTSTFSSNSLQAARIVCGRKLSDVRMDGMVVNGSGRLAEIAALVRGMGIATSKVNAAGDMTYQLKVETLEPGVHRSDVKVQVADLEVFQEGGQAAPVGAFKFTAGGEVKTGSDRILEQIKGLAVDVESGAFTLEGKAAKYLTGPDLQQTVIEKAKWSADIDVRKTLRIAGAVGAISTPASGGGRIKASGTVDTGRGRVEFPFTLAVKDLSFQRGNDIISEPEVKLDFSGALDHSEDRLSIRNMRLESRALGLDIAGTLDGLSREKMADFKGSYSCDYARAASLLRIFKDMDIAVSGKGSEKFLYRGTLAGPDWQTMLRQCIAETSFKVESVKAFGLDLKDFKAKVNAKHGVVIASARTGVNGGTLSIEPVLDFTGAKALMTMPKDSRLLDGVAINTEMCDKLLGRIHPVFYGSAATEGTLGLTLSECRLPLDEGFRDNLQVSGALDLKDTVLTPAGILKDVIELIQLEPSPVKVTDRTITFVCANGRMEPAPLEVRMKDFVITFSGWVGLDGKLSYVAEVPVTEKMVGTNYFKYVRNVRLKLPIGGTVDRPVLGRQQLKQASADLIKDIVIEAGTDALVEAAGKALEDLFGDRKKKKKKISDAPAAESADEPLSIDKPDLQEPVSPDTDSLKAGPEPGL
jgi:hypothetical protein